MNRGHVHSALRDGTHALHVRVNQHPAVSDLVRPTYTMERYRNLLAAYFSFYAVLEPGIVAASANHAGGFSYTERRKLPWLEADLRALGVDHPNCAATRSTGAGPWLPSNQAELIGVLYSIEGSTLGGQIISRSLQQHLGLTAEGGLRFFSGYGDQTEQKWSEFLEFAERLDDGPAELASAVDAAGSVFVAIERTLNEL